ncbi:MAG: tyrosine-type recombinase/integrase, partial [Spirochaetaceae bacterium]|nr:tyrosine-type recombinase/integrase [Spirochaetaceae bacterium]
LWPSRDEAIIKCLYSSGCRVGELAGLKLRDLSSDLSSAIVLGKGKKERRVFFSAEKNTRRSFLPFPRTIAELKSCDKSLSLSPASSPTRQPDE